MTTRRFGFLASKSPPKTKEKNEKKKELAVSGKLEDFKRILELARPERMQILQAMSLLLVTSGISISVPYFVGKLIDIMYTSPGSHGEIMSDLYWTCFGLSGLFLGGALANVGRLYYINDAGQKIVKRLRQDLFASVACQEMAFFDHKSSGELITRLSSDTNLVGKALTNNISDGMRACVQAIGGVSLMLYTSPDLTMLALMVVPPVTLIARQYGQFLRNITRQVQDKLADSNRHAEERFSNMATVRAFSREEREMGVYNDIVHDVYRMSRKEALARAGFFGFNGLAGNMIALLVLYQGGAMMLEAQITVGNLTSFLMYTVYVGFSLSGLGNFYSELMKGIGASGRIWGIMDTQPSIPLHGGVNISQVVDHQTISFQQVSFKYPVRPNATILDNLNIDIPSGRVTAIVGESGSGKSTLASLLLRYYDVQQGSISIGGHDLRSFDPMSLREYIGTVSQEPVLFSMSIAENIAYGLPEQFADVSMNDVIDAARQANAYDFIMSFPDGFNTMVGERGQMLSGGQRQRIAIARAIIKNPKILLLDEATSALDAETEYLVQDALHKLMVDRTTVVVAHRLSTIKSAHQIVVLKDGRVGELGSYQQLMSMPDGVFKQLVEKQSLQYIDSKSI